MHDETIQSLEDLWPRQAELNARTGLDTLALGRRLRKAEAEGRLADETPPPVLLDAGRAIKNYIDALAGECHELQDCLSWKHWYAEAKQGRQYELQNLQNARVEATDMLFFWISLCQLLGLAPEDVYRLYEKKLGINHRRQDEDRTQSEHGLYEGENRQVV